MRHSKTIVSLLLTAVIILSAVPAALPAGAQTDPWDTSPPFIFYDLSDANAVNSFTSMSNVLCFYNEGERSVQLATTGADDPHLNLSLGGASADIYKYIAVTYRVPVSNSGASGRTQFFFLANGTGASRAGNTFRTFAPSYSYKTEIIDLSGDPYWTGPANALRIDPFEFGYISAWDTLYLHSVVLFKTMEDAQDAAPYLNEMADGDTADIENFEQNVSCTSYSAGVYTAPVWEGNIVYHEACLPLLNADGTMSPISMVYDIDRVISVRNSYQNIEYKYGRDYVVSNGRLLLKTKAEGGQIDTVPYSKFFQPYHMNDDYFYSWSFGGFLYCRDIEFYQKAQIAVTYTHSDSYSLFRPSSKTATLDRAVEKLRSNEPMNIVFCGDSITFGCNCSSYIGIPPYCPKWSQLTVDGLAERYGNSNLHHFNTAICGQQSDWGFATAEENMIAYDPDLVVIALGCNDASWAITPAAYAENMRGAVSKVKAACPDCDIILVASLILNPELQPDRVPYFLQYQDALWDIAMTTDHVAVVDITSMHRSLLTRKRYVDVTENNVNHINDYMSRIYAQSVIAALTGTETPDTAPVSKVVAADTVYASDNVTMLSPDGGNNPNGTYIGRVSDKGIYAFGWLACNKRVRSFGYRYGDRVVLNSGKYDTAFAVTEAGLSVAGLTGATNRFRIYIPIDRTQTEVTAVAQLSDGSITDIWRITYTADPVSSPAELRYITSPDEIFAPDGVTDLANVGMNDPDGTHICTDGLYSVTAFGWFACSHRIEKFGYRYGSGPVVLNSDPMPAEPAVIGCGAPYAGATGETRRFSISIPLDANASEVFAVAQLEDGRIVDMWKIIYGNEPVIPTVTGVFVDNYNLTIRNARDITAVRFAKGVYETASGIKNAPGCVNLSAAVIAASLEGDDFVYELPDGGIYSVWYKYSDGTQKIESGLDATHMTQTVTADGVKVTVHNLYGVKDYYMAKGRYTTYRQTKSAPGCVEVPASKFGSAHSYTYSAAVGDPGEYTLYIRYTDPERPDEVLYFSCEVTCPEVSAFGRLITVSHLDGIKVVRVAPGTYGTSRDVKNSQGCRNFNAREIEKLKNSTGSLEVLNVADAEGTAYTVSVEYSNLYTEIHHITVRPKVPVYEVSGDTITITGLDGVSLLRFAPGTYKTAAGIKNAEGSRFIRPTEITANRSIITGLHGRYTFLVQYVENSQNIFTVDFPE